MLKANKPGRRLQLVPNGQQKAYDRQRGSSRQRGYDTRWEKTRNAFLRDHPLCQRCHEAGRVRAAQEVHHRIPVRYGGAMHDPANLMSLCRSCHKVMDNEYKRSNPKKH